MIEASAIRDWIERVAITALLIAAFFLAFPQTDFLISFLFGDAGAFPLRRVPAWNAMRDVLLGLTDGGMLVAIAVLVAGLVWPSCRAVRTRILAFALASYAAAPGLLVNAVFKSCSGRARPWNVDLFGGDAAFSPVLTYADQCRSHCSFVSGEASALATVATILLLVAVPAVPARHRPLARGCIIAVAVAGSLLRVAFGAHFLSDVIFAWLVAVPVVLILHAAFRIDRLPTPFANGVKVVIQQVEPTLQHRNSGDSISSR